MIEGSRILLVDDTPEVIQLLTDFLGAYSCQIYTASTGKQAIDLLGRENIEIVVLDIKLPDTDGLLLLDTIKLHDPAIAVVMITGYNDPELIIEAMKKGASDFLIKPFSIDKLLLVMMRVRKQRDLLIEKSNMLSDLEDRRKIEVLNRQLETKIAELTKMYHISNRFNSFSIFEDIYEKSVGVVNETLNLDGAGYYIVDQDSRQLILYRANENTNSTIQTHIALGRDILAELKSGKRHFVKEGIVYSPVVIKGECVGVLMAEGKTNGHASRSPFTEEDFYFLRLIADKASVQIENRMLYESLFESVLHTLTSLIIAINRRDMYTEGHCKRVADMSLSLANCVGASEYDKDVIRVVAPIHDVGKIGIPDSILLKPAKLSDEEYTVMKSHSVYGEEIINRFDILSNEARITRHHHEFFDGSGYPDRLTGTAIPYCSRIIALCDTWDAMTTDRPYRRGMTRSAASNEIRRCRGSQFDPDLADCFLDLVESEDSATTTVD